ncbi:MAG: hypothetical protein KF726_06200 [Anaerolineae bacterium]|nr:hypothetical protein [Anaerolineae bacterium]
MLKTKFRLVLMAVLALTLAFVPALSLNPARAQGASCLPGLDEATCTLLSDAFTNAGTLTKFVMDYTLDIKADANTISVKGNGPIDLTKTAADASSMMSGGSADSSAALKGIVMQQTVTATSVTDGKEDGGTIEFRIVDGFIYYTTDGGDKWQKADLTKAATSMQESVEGMAGMGGTGSTGGAGTAEAQAAAMQIMGVFMSPDFQKLFSDPSKFLATEVTDGGEVEGVSTQKITLNIKLGELLGTLTSADAAPLIAAIGKAAGLPEGQESMITGMAAMFKPVLDASTFAISWWVDPAAKQFRGFGLDIHVKVDAQTQMMMGGMTGGSGAGAEAPKDVEFNLAFAVTLTKIGEDVVVEPVADAVEVNLDAPAN